MRHKILRRLMMAGAACLMAAMVTVPAMADEKTADSSTLTEAQIALGPGFAGNPGAAESHGLEAGSQTGPGSAADPLKQGEAASAAMIETAEKGDYIGSFEATGYCNCSTCSGGYGLTYSGTVPQAKRTVSADLNRYPIGTKLWIDGIVYTVEDKGSSVVDNRLDIYFASHAEALAFGWKTIEVYAPKEGTIVQTQPTAVTGPGAETAAGTTGAAAADPSALTPEQIRLGPGALGM